MNKPKIYEELAQKLSISGGTIQYLSFPVGNIYYNGAEGYQHLAVGGYTPGVSAGPLLVLRDVRNTEWDTSAGNISLYTRMKDGTTGPSLDLYPDGHAYWNVSPVLTAADSAMVAGYALPGSLYVDWTLGASGTMYTMPADGWLSFSKTASQSGQIIYMRNETRAYALYNTANINEPCCGVLPVRKSDQIEIVYTTGGTTNVFRFIYAEGAL